MEMATAEMTHVMRIFLLKQGGVMPVLDEEVETSPDEEAEREKAYLCRSCGNVVTRPADMISVNGGHRHTFTNPAGFVFEIGLFKNAAGCLTAGEPTDEFTWFPGFRWSYALCSNCRNHLGWRYLSEGSGFFGLVVDYLAENW